MSAEAKIPLTTMESATTETCDIDEADIGAAQSRNESSKDIAIKVGRNLYISMNCMQLTDKDCNFFQNINLVHNKHFFFIFVFKALKYIFILCLSIHIFAFSNLITNFYVICCVNSKN